MFLVRIFLMALGLAAALAPVAQAQSPSWPNRPIRLIVPFPPGGGTDAFARPLSKVLSQNLGQQVVIDNRGGAGGTLGAELTAKSAPDGYTFIVGAVHHTIAVSMYPKLGYDLVRDLTPVTVVSYVPNVVVINPQRVPVKTFAEFQAYVRANPGKLNYGSAGNGTTHHLTVELWKTLTRSYAAHIPYRGAGPALQDLLAGQVDFMFDGLGSAIAHIKAGKLVPLAVSSSQRSFALPDIPTLNEAGVNGYEARTWYALWAPAGTPREIVSRMQQETAKALAGSELKGIWQTLGAEAGGQSPEEMARFVDSEIKKWAKVVKDSGAKLD
ncbi:MAG: tripartite tricarboxylate transporter substrate binding protein [Zoogloea sp.]|nr:tripartite tricarboxylate transporter substrate binding protein [Burkholderiaceae bacterium]MBP7395308.1 tripartite tricarboxylate transporter substrate binding protein [Zoogloea sp.]